FNHYSIGAVGEWINKIILGINLDENNPGYKHVILKPQPGGSLTWAKGHYESIHGNITSSWKINRGKFIFKVSIPTNTTATVYLPAENVENVTENGKPIKNTEEIQFMKFENNSIKIKINSGKYNFESKYPI
ncbi:MAG: alpha-L-rhamnosidase, partial [archaeon]|nr:alpha-L-rhamnosidase [archaeon]